MAPVYAANLSTLFLEHPFRERFAAAKAAGFDVVECWSPYELPISEVRTLLDDNGLSMLGINTATGDDDVTQWGYAALPGREAEFERILDQALWYASALGVANIHVMAGGTADVDRSTAEHTYLRNLELALARSEGSGVSILIEPLNARDRPGYLLQRSDRAAVLIRQLGTPERLRILFDMYHLQIMEGDILTRLRRHLPLIGHVQIAGVPSRAEPDEGELDYAQILLELGRLGWTAPIGCEYFPRTTTEDGLGWREALAERMG